MQGMALGAARPLSGIRVLDFSWSLPGPYATKMLSDLGAEVDAVDLEGRPEIFRTLPPLAGDVSHAWRYVNHGKRRRTVNHRDNDEIVSVIQELGGYDILVEQFRPGAMEAWGLGFEKLSALYPQLIYCSITGYGQDGACRDRAGHDINYLALSGVAESMRAFEEAPALSSLPIADLAGGSLHAVIAMLAALRERDRSGSGVHIDISMTDALWALNAFAGPAALNGEGEAPGEGLLDGGSFYGYYRTRDGRFLAIGGLESKFIDNLFSALGRPDLIASAKTGDSKMQKVVRAELSAIIEERDFSEWRRFFAPLDVCVEPVLTVAEAASHPHFISRNAVGKDDEGFYGFASPLRFMKT